MLKATPCAVTQLLPLHAAFESCSSQRSRRTASCSSKCHRQALHAALMLPSPCRPGTDAGQSQELATAGAADAAWQDTEAGEARPGHQRLHCSGFGCALQCEPFEGSPAGVRLPSTALSYAAGEAGYKGDKARLPAERMESRCSQPSGQRGRQQPRHCSHQEAAPAGPSAAWQPQRLTMPTQHARDQSSDGQTGTLPPSSRMVCPGGAQIRTGSPYTLSASLQAPLPASTATGHCTASPFQTAGHSHAPVNCAPVCPGPLTARELDMLLKCHLNPPFIVKVLLGKLPSHGCCTDHFPSAWFDTVHTETALQCS